MGKTKHEKQSGSVDFGASDRRANSKDKKGHSRGFSLLDNKLFSSTSERAEAPPEEKMAVPHASDPKAIIHESCIKGDLNLLKSTVQKHIFNQGRATRSNTAVELDLEKLPLTELPKKKGSIPEGSAPLKRNRVGTGDLPPPKDFEAAAKDLTDFLNGQHPDQKSNKEAYPLAEAAYFDKSECVQFLLQFGSDPNVVDSEGSTPLSHAIWNGNMDITQMLVDAGAKTDIVDSEGHHLVHKAAWQGHRKVLNFLLDKLDCPANLFDDCKYTPLMLAAQRTHYKCVEVLIDAGARVFATDLNQMTALHHAAYIGSFKSAKVLLKSLSEEEMTTLVNAPNNENLTALNFACEGGYTELAKFLIEHGAKFNEKTVNPLNNAAFNGNLEICQLLISAGYPINVKKGESSPLHSACFSGHNPIVELLLKKGAAIDHTDHEGATPLHKACFKSHANCAELLISEKASVNIKDNDGDTPLHIASYVGSSACLELLLKNDCQLNAENKKNQTALFHAASRSHFSCLQTLLNAKINVNHQDHLQNTALMWAVLAGHKPITKELLHRGADPQAKNKRGLTATHLAIRYPETLSSLLKFHPNLEIVDQAGRTPLFYAVKLNLEQSARLLIFAGANLDVTDKKGKSLFKISSLLNRQVLNQISKEKSEQLDQTTLKEYKIAAKTFNEKPTKGIDLLKQQKATPQQVAKFLHNAENLNKKLIGDYLGENDSFATEVLQQFVEYFDFAGFDFDHAVRYYLSKFRLPGEAQKIDRIMEAFAKQYCRNNPKTFSHPDTAYLLGFSVIMLNTDLHNPSIKKEKKMTIDDFLKNNRKIDQGKDIPKEYLKKIYNNIKKDQIQMDATGSVYHNAEKKGWMLKRGGRIKTWKKRWFVLNDNCLYYFKTPKDKQPLGIIPLENLAVRISSEKSGRKNLFELYQKDRTQEMKAMKITTSGGVAKGHHDTYLFSVESIEDRDEWIQSIEGNIFKNPFLELTNKKLNSKKRVVSFAPRSDIKKTENVKINFKTLYDYLSMCANANLDKSELSKLVIFY